MGSEFHDAPPQADRYQITTHCLDETQKLGEKIGRLIKSPMAIALTGDLGSGKTAFVQGLAKGLEVPPEYYITSPTFTLVNEYPGRRRLFHIDLYRLDHYGDLEDVGFYDILETDGVVAIEWAEKLSNDLLSNYIALRFDSIDDETRKITVVASGQEAIVLIKALG